MRKPAIATTTTMIAAIIPGLRFRVSTLSSPLAAAGLPLLQPIQRRVRRGKLAELHVTVRVGDVLSARMPGERIPGAVERPGIERPRPVEEMRLRVALRVGDPRDPPVVLRIVRVVRVHVR